MDPNSADFGSLTSYLIAFNQAVRERNGLRLECLLSLTSNRKNPSLHRLKNAGLLQPAKVPQDQREVAGTVPAGAWQETVNAFWHAAALLALESDAVACFEQAAAVLQCVTKGFARWEAWALPVLFGACRDARVLAIRADDHRRARGDESNTHLEEAARLINKAFTICITDRAPMQQSRKWGTYCVIGILFRTYFRLNRVSLTKNVLRAVEVSELPPLDYFPKAHVVTWRYYQGVIAFLSEDYARAESELTLALQQCDARRAQGNQERVLAYLVPTHLMTTRRLPSRELLRRFPVLANLYSPLLAALRSGNVAAYDRALRRSEHEFIRRRVYLTLERARDLCLRSLFRKVYLALGKQTRIPIAKFAVAMNVGLKQTATVKGAQNGGDAKPAQDAELERHEEWVDEEEAECFVANMIYKKFVKGYISRERRMVVLSANDPFPRMCKRIE